MCARLIWLILEIKKITKIFEKGIDTPPEMWYYNTRRNKKGDNKMFGIYRYWGGLKFMGIVARTEEEAWAYLDKTHGREINGVWYGANRDVYVVQEIELV